MALPYNTWDIINFPPDNVTWTKQGRKKVHTNKEYVVTYKVWGRKPEVVDVEHIWEEDKSKDVIDRTDHSEQDAVEQATKNYNDTHNVNRTNVNKSYTDTTSTNKRVYNHHLAWRWTNVAETVGEWYVTSTDHRRFEASGTETHAQVGTESYREVDTGVETSNTTRNTVTDTESDIVDIGQRWLDRERASLRKNVLMVLRENTIAIDYRRITSSFPKWKKMREIILDYESKRGLDLAAVATVTVEHIFIL